MKCIFELYLSRFTPNATGDQVDLKIGEVVKYNRKGIIITVKIDSGRMTHDACENLGYEAIWIEEPGIKPEYDRIFIDGKKITWWEGKTDSIEQLNDLTIKASFNNQVNIN